MPIQVVIPDVQIQQMVEVQIRSAITGQVIAAEVSRAVGEAIGQITADRELINKAVQDSVTRVCNDSAFLDELVKASILKGASKLEGAFDGAIKAAGKRMALESETLTLVTENVRVREKVYQENLAVKAEKLNRVIRLEEQGHGQFAS